MTNIYSVAKFFLNKESEMSSKKLQKICWYAYSWYIALNTDPEEKDNVEFLFDNKAEAWVHGPVFRELYTDVKHNSKKLIERSIEIDNKEIENFLNEIWDVYGQYTGDQLESITHQEKPWLEVRENLKYYEASTTEIKTKSILDEYLPRLMS